MADTFARGIGSAMSVGSGLMKASEARSSGGAVPRSGVGPAPPPQSASTLVEILRWRAVHQPQQRAFTFLTDGEAVEESVGYQELDRRARAVAVVLLEVAEKGDRVLLLYPAGLEFHAGFLGCLYAGMVAVPTYPPDPVRRARTLPRLQAIVADAQARVVLTTASILSIVDALFVQAPELENLRWLASDSIGSERAERWQDPSASGATLAFLQYTSGSTGMPKGVMLTHANLLHNQAVIASPRVCGHTEQSVWVSWLPLYHDMGMCGGLLQPLYGGFHAVILSPLAFLQRPVRWLQAISRYRANTSGGPNFAYDLCVRRTSNEQRATLDLSSWDFAFNGSEPVRDETLQRFADTFADCGFRREAFYPCYGLAEATLIVAGGHKASPPVTRTLNKAALDRGEVVEDLSGKQGSVTLVGCGQTIPDQKILIADPESLRQCAPHRIGEIWVSGPSVGQGYWQRPEETERSFRGFLADTGEGPFLRTGDLGFLSSDELVVTGRLKDLIIIRGRNHYPTDIERTAEGSHPTLRAGCSAAFSVDVSGEERLVLVQELDRHQDLELNEAIGAIRQQVTEQHDVEVYAVSLIKRGSIPKTSSGKVQHHACRELFLNGRLDLVADWRRGAGLQVT